MRTIVELPDDQVQALDTLGRKYALSRAELVRRAVDKYLKWETDRTAGSVDRYFGMFKDDPGVFGGLDALAFQRKARAEWDARDAAVEQGLQSQGMLHDSAGKDYRK